MAEKKLCDSCGLGEVPRNAIIQWCERCLRKKIADNQARKK